MIEDFSDYTGTLKRDKSNLTTSIGTASFPKINQTLGTLTTTANHSLILADGSSFTGGTIDLTSLSLTEGTTLFTLPEEATVAIGSGATIRFAVGAGVAFPFSVAVDLGAGASLAWNQPTVVFGPYQVSSSLSGGTLTFDLIRDAVAFTPPSAYWEEKTKPANAIRVWPPTTGTIDFLGDANVCQEIDGKTSVAVSFAGNGSATTDLFGLHGSGKGSRATIENDIWLAATGSTLRTLVGASDNNWINNQASSLHGDILINAKAGAITDIVGGYLNAGYSDSLDFRGNIGITLEGTTRLTGTLVAASTSGHSQHPRHFGDTAILIKNLQSANNATATSYELPPGFIIGGHARTNRTGGDGHGTLTGNSAITLAIGEGSGSFVKTLVGGSHSEGGTGTLTFIGDTAIDISAPATITFSAPIYGGGYAKTTSQNAPLTGSTSVTLRGGTYTSTITPAGLNAPVSGSATLTLSGGTYTGATLAGTQGSSTGGSTLIIDAEIDLTGAAVENFSAITLSPAASLTLGETSGIGALTLAADATFALDTPASIDTLNLADGAILEKTEAEGSILTIATAINPPASGKTAVSYGSIPAIGEKIYLITGAGAVDAATRGFAAPERCVIRSDSGGIFLIQQSGILISIY